MRALPSRRYLWLQLSSDNSWSGRLTTADAALLAIAASARSAADTFRGRARGGHHPGSLLFVAPSAPCRSQPGECGARLTCPCRVSRTNCSDSSICSLVCRCGRLERLLPLCCPQRSRLFALIALELVCDPEQRSEN